jgi:hypothetical protein
MKMTKCGNLNTTKKREKGGREGIWEGKLWNGKRKCRKIKWENRKKRGRTKGVQ